MVIFRCQIKTKNTKKGLSMDILNTLRLESNRQIKINFDVGVLSSDAGASFNQRIRCKNWLYEVDQKQI